MSVKKRALGRGLDALFGAEAAPAEAITTIGVDQLRPNPFQPRHHFNAQALEELTVSIREKGILQPLIVRKTDENFEIVAGERRWRAAQQAGLKQVPVIVRSFKDQEMLELALVENLQREDLNAVEEARAYRQLIQEFEATQEQIADRVGKSRVAVTNALRLLRLPEQILTWIEEQRLSAGHAKALLSLEREPLQLALSREIMRKELSVREAESRVRKLLNRPDANLKAKEPKIEIETRDLQDKLSLHLGLKVKIYPISNTAGKIEVHYTSLDEFQRFFDHLGISFEQDR